MPALEELKTGPNFTVYRSGDLKLIKIYAIRFSYPHFGAKRVDTQEDGSKKENWGGVAMLPKSTHVAAKEAFVELMNELMTKNEVKVPPEFRCIKNGDDKDDENMHGHWLITFSDSVRRPAVRDRQGGLLTDESVIDKMFYGGVWGDVLLRPWYFNGLAKGKSKPYPKRICCGFTGVMLGKDDKPFGNGVIDDTNAWGVGKNTSGGDGMDDEDDGL